MSVAMSVRERLLQDDPDLATDETAMRAELEQGTDVYDVMRRLAVFALDAKSMAEAAKARADALAARQERYRRREQYARQALFGMMDALGETKLPDPEFTVSIRPGTAGVIITDETAIPAAYVRIVRTPDKAAIKDALKAGETIPGAELANGAPVLTLRSN